LPYLFAGLQIAAPAAFLGAMVGEFTGAERGMGVLTIRAIRALDVEMTWALATVATAVSIIAYLAIGALGRRVLLEAPPVILAAPSGGGGRRRAAWIDPLLVPGLALALWAGAIWAFGLNPFFAKGPGDVFAALVTATDAPETRAAIGAELERRGTDAWWIGEVFDGQPVLTDETLPLDAPGRATIRMGEEEREVPLGLRGEFQAENAAIAWAALERLDGTGFGIPSMAIRKGLASARWPGRLEVVPDGGRTMVFDCGHNPDGCEAFGAFLGRRRLPGPVVLLFGAMADKDHAGMLAPFDPYVDERIYAIPPMRRAPEDASVFTAVRPGRVAPSVSEGLALARRAAGEGGTVLVAGSVFLVQAARAELLHIRSDPPIAM